MIKITFPDFRLTLLTAAILFAIVSCEVSSPALKTTGNNAANASANPNLLAIADLHQGYKLFVMNCSGCHSLYEPTSRSRDYWEHVLPEMLGKAKLDSVEGALIKNYIFSKL